MALDYLTWWLVSPGVACFLLLNVLVAAIAVTSRSRRAQQDDDGASTRRRRLCRSASSMVLDRLRSFAKHPSVDFCHYISPEAAEEPKQVTVSGAANDDRHLAVPEPVAMPTISTVSEGRHAQEPMPLSSPPPQAAAPAVAVVTAATARVAAALVSQPPKEEPAPVAELVKCKHRRRDHVVYAVEGKAELNARAEQFIREFRQELRLQRLDSMLSRHTHTLSNGSGGAPTSR